MHSYKQKYFHCTYPNVILLVASWDSITPDAHNEARHFASAIGKSMYSLSSSNLVDPHRANVVVVVTKSMSSWDQFDDFESGEEKNTQWVREADRRRSIIIDIQRKVFPNLALWKIVFVENGGGTNMRAKYPKLPDGELSHQNLFEAIRSVVETAGPDGTYDLAGMHVLDFLAGSESLDLAPPPETEILLRRSEAVMVSSRNRLRVCVNFNYPGL
jgi:hypothetical protein